jgi:hypothetical protein
MRCCQAALERKQIMGAVASAERDAFATFEELLHDAACEIRGARSI